MRAGHAAPTGGTRYRLEFSIGVPHPPEDYIHRVGRTARAGATGEAFTFVSEQEHSELRAIERAVKKSLPRRRLDGFDYRNRAANWPRSRSVSHRRQASSQP